MMSTEDLLRTGLILTLFAFAIIGYVTCVNSILTRRKESCPPPPPPPGKKNHAQETFSNRAVFDQSSPVRCNILRKDMIDSLRKRDAFNVDNMSTEIMHAYGETDFDSIGVEKNGRGKHATDLICFRRPDPAQLCIGATCMDESQLRSIVGIKARYISALNRIGRERAADIDSEDSSLRERLNARSTSIRTQIDQALSLVRRQESNLEVAAKRRPVLRRRIKEGEGKLFRKGVGSKEGEGNILAKGGDRVFEWNEYTVHVFESPSGSSRATHFFTNRPGTVDVLVVGGGGGGGDQRRFDTAGGGGGGGGGVIWRRDVQVAAGITEVTVGKGASAAGSNKKGNRGEDSSFGSLRALGGGGGGTRDDSPTSGGSGGGARSEGDDRNGAAGLQPSSVEVGGGMGSNGGTGVGGSGNSQGGGGGGGATSAGSSNGRSSRSSGGEGGRGYDASSDFGDQVGDSGWFAGGGGGGTASSSGSTAAGGKGGGGRGGRRGSGPAGDGMRGSGGGGGGGASRGSAAGGGGSGVVIVRYLTSSLSPEMEPSMDPQEGASPGLRSRKDIGPGGGDRGVEGHGGDRTFSFDGHIVHVFEKDGKFRLNLSGGGGDATVDVLVVGGGGGSYSSGQDTSGGGAGGLVFRPGLRLSPGEYDVEVGEGGVDGRNGRSSAFGRGTSLELRGLGGGGTGRGRNLGDGFHGGSGSGAGRGSGRGGSGLQPSQKGDSGGYGHGNRGGNNSGGGTEGAGGGGAGETGTDYSSSGSVGSGTSVKRGGDGLNMSKYFGQGVGDGGWFAGGGGGGGERGSGSLEETRGGRGGGGRGGHPGWSRDGADGFPGTGGGGGGSDNRKGGNGGSGIVLIRYSRPSVKEEHREQTDAVYCVLNNSVDKIDKASLRRLARYQDPSVESFDGIELTRNNLRLLAFDNSSKTLVAIDTKTMTAVHRYSYDFDISSLRSLPNPSSGGRGNVVRNDGIIISSGSTMYTPRVADTLSSAPSASSSPPSSSLQFYASYSDFPTSHSHLQISPDGRWFYFSDGGSAQRTYKASMTTMSVVDSNSDYPNRIRALWLSYDGRYLYSGNRWKRQACLTVDTSNMKTVRDFRDGSFWVTGTAIASMDGKVIIVSRRDAGLLRFFRGPVVDSKRYAEVELQGGVVRGSFVHDHTDPTHVFILTKGEGLVKLNVDKAEIAGSKAMHYTSIASSWRPS